VRPFNVVLDAGSAWVDLWAPLLFDRLPCKTTRLCFTIDGRFPNHEANPLIEENRRDIVEQVIAEKADIGIAWDGDADRCFFIDGTGEFVPGDFVTALLAEAFLLKHPAATILYDLRASPRRPRRGRSVRRHLAHESRRHAFFQAAHARNQRHLRGEVTGHYYFRDNFYADNGFIRVVDPRVDVEEGPEPATAARAAASQVTSSPARSTPALPSMAAVPAKLDEIAVQYADAHQYKLDGISIEYPDWHFNVRPSNTEPLLRLNLEAVTAELMAAKRDEVLALIRA